MKVKIKKLNINLIARAAQDRIWLLKIKKILWRAAIACVGIFISLLLLIILALFLFDRQIKLKQEKISLLKKQINSFEKVESLLATVVAKVKGAEVVLHGRHGYSENVSNLASLLVPGFNLGELEVGVEGKIKMSGNCNDVQSLTNFNARLEEIKSKKLYSKVFYPSVNRAPSGKYSIELNLEK